MYIVNLKEVNNFYKKLNINLKKNLKKKVKKTVNQLCNNNLKQKNYQIIKINHWMKLQLKNKNF